MKTSMGMTEVAASMSAVMAGFLRCTASARVRGLSETIISWELKPQVR